MRGEFLDLDGARVYYYAAGTRGAGEPVVLLHGFPTCGHLWGEVVPLLPDGHRIVVVDLLGFGRSDPPGTHDVTLRGHARRTLALLDALRIDQACLVGHDLGGGIAQLVATEWPARVSRLGLVNSVAYGGWPTRDVRLARLLAPLARTVSPTLLVQVLRSALARGYDDPNRAARSLDRYTRPFAGEEGRAALVRHVRSLDAAATRGLAPALRALATPTAIVWGADDPFLSPKLARRLQRDIPQATLDVIEGARHFTPEESPARVAGAIRALLARAPLASLQA